MKKNNPINKIANSLLILLSGILIILLFTKMRSPTGFSISKIFGLSDISVFICVIGIIGLLSYKVLTKENCC